MVTDPVADFINRLKNASSVGKLSVSSPYSKFTHAIAEGLKKEGFISSVEKSGKQEDKILTVELVHVIKTACRLSKPSRRLYSGSKNIPSRRGNGKTFISTPKGVMSAQNARKQNLGGELLFVIE